MGDYEGEPRPVNEVYIKEIGMYRYVGIRYNIYIYIYIYIYMSNRYVIITIQQIV